MSDNKGEETPKVEKKEDSWAEVERIFKEEPARGKKMLDQLGISDLKDWAKATANLNPVERDVLTQLVSARMNQPQEEVDEFDKDFHAITRQFQRMEMMKLFGKRYFQGEEVERNGHTDKGMAQALQNAMEPMSKTLEAISKKIVDDEKSEFKQLIETLALKMDNLKPGSPPSEMETLEDTLTRIEKFTTVGKKFLAMQGYDVETKPTTGTMPDAETLVTMLESKGYKIAGKPIPFEQYEKEMNEKLLEGKKMGAEDKTADRVAGLIEGITEKFFSLVLGPTISRQWTTPEEYSQMAQQAQARTQPQAETQPVDQQPAQDGQPHTRQPFTGRIRGNVNYQQTDGQGSPQG